MEEDRHPELCVLRVCSMGSRLMWLRLYKNLLDDQCNAIITSRPVIVHLHLLKLEVGAVLEEG